MPLLFLQGESRIVLAAHSSGWCVWIRRSNGFPLARIFPTAADSATDFGIAPSEGSERGSFQKHAAQELAVTHIVFARVPSLRVDSRRDPWCTVAGENPRFLLPPPRAVSTIEVGVWSFSTRAVDAEPAARFARLRVHHAESLDTAVAVGRSRSDGCPGSGAVSATRADTARGVRSGAGNRRRARRVCFYGRARCRSHRPVHARHRAGHDLGLRNRKCRRSSAIKACRGTFVAV